MKAGAQLAAAIDVLAMVKDAWEDGERTPVDGVLSYYYKSHRYIGSKDRKEIAKWVYFVLRYGATLEWWLEQAQMRSSPRLLVLLALVFKGKADVRMADEYFSGEVYCPEVLTPEECALVERYMDLHIMHGDMPDSVRLNYPEWMETRLKAIFGDNLYVAMEALNEEASLDLRVNTLKASREEVLWQLDKLGMNPTMTPHSPLGVRLPKREPVMTTKLYNEGLFEIQDEGSQMLAALVDAKAGEKVIDFCAGAGGKTLAIAAAMENKGRILALDVHEMRMSQMKKRLARAGVNNVTTHVLSSEQDSYLKRHRDSADWVLVDAPCSGSGTWRRNPDMKWRMGEKDLREVIEKQARILESASRLVKVGGKLVYATCSIFHDENERQIEAFCLAHPEFHLYGDLSSAQQCYLRMFPHQHDTDGFFGAVLERLV